MRAIRASTVLAILLIADPTAVAADTAELILRDAAGELVGSVVGPAVEVAADPGFAGETLFWVARPIAGMSILLLTDHETFRDTRDLVPLFYESSDCSGSAFLDAPAEPDGYAVAIIFDTNIFWPAARGTSRVIRSVGTLVRKSTDCTDLLVAPQFCCATVEGGQTLLTAPSTGLDIAELGLRIPFRLEQETAAD